jgi:hypothetical protein
MMLELTVPWRTSSYTVRNEACVEVAGAPARVLIRDTKADGKGPILMFSPAAFTGLVGQIKAGRLDR